MDIIFCGDMSHNNGPSNVNKGFQQYANFRFIDTKGNNKKKIIADFMKSLFKSKVVIFSGSYRVNTFFCRLAKLFRKKTICILHGYEAYETIENKIKNGKRNIRMEKIMLKNVDLILPVSKNYAMWFLKQKPEYTNKTHFLTNGINTEIYAKIKKTVDVEDRENIISVCGANRFLKCNGKVSECVQSLNDEDKKCTLNVFGYIYEDGDDIISSDCIKIHGRIPQEVLFDNLLKTKLFILNTKRESFGLSVVDALICGCNILVSKNAGITGLLDLKENDIINDFNDVEEIKKKIQYNLKNNNNERLLKSLDLEHYSCQNSTKRLEQIASCLLNNKDYKNIE